MARILLIEDDTDLGESVRSWLADEDHAVSVASAGLTGIDMVKSEDFDLIILDLSLPDIDGLQVCKIIRSDRVATPVLILTGRTGIDDKETGFLAGGDDYLTKPFDMRELSLRVMALLRRPADYKSETLAFGPLSIDRKTRRALKGSDELSLTKLEFELLWTFMSDPGRVFKVPDLVRKAWPADSSPSAAAVRVCVSELRKKLGPEDEPSMIRNIHGMGYRLEQVD